MHEGQPKVSVIMIARNGADVIGEQLGALATQAVSVPWEVVVADNGSTDHTADVVRDWIPRFPVALRLVDASAHRGISFARNTGVRGSRGEVLAFCDCDDVVAPGWVEAAWRGTRVGPVLAGLKREMTVPQDPLARELNPGCLVGQGIPGCSFAVRREVYFEVGGFDESMPPYGYDDSEFAIRVRKAGYAIHPEPGMTIYFRATAGLGGRIRKVFSAGVAETVLWYRHREVFLPWLQGLALGRELLRWPVDTLREMRAGRTPTPEWLARGLVSRVGHLVGFYTWVRPGRMGPEPRFVGDDPLVH